MGILSWLSLDARRGVKAQDSPKITSKTASKAQKTRPRPRPRPRPSPSLDSSESEFAQDTESESGSGSGSEFEISSGEEYSSLGTPSSSPSSTSSASDEELEKESNWRKKRNPKVLARNQKVTKKKRVTCQTNRQPRLKRVRSSWRIRPLVVEEKLKVFVQGVDDDALLHYDGGDFYRWLKDSEDGKADPAHGFPYPLLVQDADLRTILEIKGPRQKELSSSAKEATRTFTSTTTTTTTASTINVPSWHTILPSVNRKGKDKKRKSPVVKTRGDNRSTNSNGPIAASKKSLEDALAKDPPYIRYVQPTPDELDVAVEYDLDEEDEQWLKKIGNGSGKKLKLDEEMLERSIDRLEKGFSAALHQRPELWDAVVPKGDLGEMSVEERIAKVFPCPAEIDIGLYDETDSKGDGKSDSKVLRGESVDAVYSYWKRKHAEAGRPLIPRLWYEPQWKSSFLYTFTSSPSKNKNAAPKSVTKSRKRKGFQKKNEENGKKRRRQKGRSHQFSLFAPLDAPPPLAGIRKRKLEPEEVKVRFEAIRRDLEGVRTLADLVRRREKMKRKEVQMWREEWAVKMSEISGISLVQPKPTTGKSKKGKTLRHNPPALPYALTTAREMAEGRSRSLGHRKVQQLRLSLRPCTTVPSTTIPSTTTDLTTNAGDAVVQENQVERRNRARRLAARRQSQMESFGWQASGERVTGMGNMVADVKNVENARYGSTVVLEGKTRRKTPMTKKSTTRKTKMNKKSKNTKRKIKNKTDNKVLKKKVLSPRGPLPPPGVNRNSNCEWCGASVVSSTVVGCSSCPRCFCFKCFQRRPGYGINNWSRAIKDPGYVCQYCKESEPTILGPHQQQKDKKKKVLVKKSGGSYRTTPVSPPSTVSKRAQPRGPSGRFLSFQKENRKPIMGNEANLVESNSKYIPDFVAAKRRGRAN